MSIYAPLEAMGIPVLFQSTLLAALLLFVAGIFVRRRLAHASDAGLIPDEGVTLRNVLELGVGAVADLAREIIGDDYKRYMGLLLTIFCFILVSNLLNLVPAAKGATSFSDTTWAWAAISFGVYNWVGIRKHGARYAKHFFGPSFDVKIGRRTYHLPLLLPFFLILETILHFARMLTLSVRLLANMFADHLVVVSWLAMVPILIPAVFMGLGTLVSVVQAFVFTLLTMVYIGQALDEPH